ncbi:flap endonuclease GEN homolog 1 [Gastrophryne carolinensis]
MGVHELWPVLEPVKHHVPLQSLIGKTLAVDLSIWVCEAQSVKQMIGVVAKPHLRNLFFRVSSLSLMGVKLVFVTEGEAPKIKADTMNKRNEMRYGPSNKPAPSKPGRSYFKSVLKECLRMLDCLGIPWVQAAGEAEAMCAYLDAGGYVDGCITNDGDVFLYGAKTVYRNFTMNVKDPHVDCYESSAIKDKLGLDRESLVGLAILLGCDYIPKGLPGVGREMAVKFIKSLNGESMLQRFYQWRKQFDNQAVNPKTAKKTTHCSVCCHPGSSKEHTRKGCSLCGSERYCEPHDYDYQCPCEWHKAELEKKRNPLEYTMKMKAKKREGFPYREVIKEFLENKDKLSKVIKWRRPSLPCFQNFAQERMEWPRHYSCEKVFVLLTYHDMHERKAGRKHEAQLQAARILKTRVRNGVPCFEIEWVKPESYVFPDDHPPDAPLLTIEEESLVTDAYPHIVDLFQKDKMEAEMLKLKSKKSKPKSKAPPDMDDVASLLSELCLAPEKKSPLSSLAACSGDHEPLPTTSLESPSDPDDLLVSEQPSAPSVSLFPAENDLNVSTPLLFGDDDPEISEDQCCSPVQMERQEPIVSSPNVSSLVSDLHLSNIDWEATSFSQSPQVESRTTCGITRISEVKPIAPEPSNAFSFSASVSQENTKPFTHGLKHGTNQKLTPAVESPYPSHLEKLPLRERILLKNACQFENSNPQNMIPQEPVHIVSGKHKPNEKVSSSCASFKENIEVHPKLLKLPCPQKKPKPNSVITKQSGTNDRSQVSQHPTTKSFTFVKKTTLVPVRTLPDSSQTSKPKAEVRLMPVKSVCQKIALSNVNEPVSKSKKEPAIKSTVSDLTKDDPLNKMATDKPASSGLPGSAVEFGTDMFSSPKFRTAVKAVTQDEQSDLDDSIVSVDSPLPLAERLKQRLQQN